MMCVTEIENLVELINLTEMMNFYMQIYRKRNSTNELGELERAIITIRAHKQVRSLFIARITKPFSRAEAATRMIEFASNTRTANPRIGSTDYLASG